MKKLVQVLSIAALVVGLSIALFSWQAENIGHLLVTQHSARVVSNTGEVGEDTYTTPAFSIPDEDRALGLGFGMGLSFLGAFGLYALLRVSGPPDEEMGR